MTPSQPHWEWNDTDFEDHAATLGDVSLLVNVVHRGTMAPGVYEVEGAVDYGLLRTSMHTVSMN